MSHLDRGLEIVINIVTHERGFLRQDRMVEGLGVTAVHEACVEEGMQQFAVGSYEGTPVASRGHHKIADMFHPSVLTCLSMSLGQAS